MPRSGSTLIQNILGQNPNFYVTPTSGLLELIFAARGNYTNSPEFKAQDPKEMQQAFLSFCRGGMESYFTALTDKPYVVDKSRGWGIHYNFLNMIYPQPKIICMVRDLRSVITSMEKLYRKNADKMDPIINHNDMRGTTVYKRINTWLNTQPIGLALERINEIFQQKISNNIHFIRYEDLLTYPDETLNKIYDYLEIEPYKHDFTNIPQITQEDDTVYGIFGDHRIQTALVPLKEEYNNVLGYELSQYVVNQHKWYFEIFYPELLK